MNKLAHCRQNHIGGLHFGFGMYTTIIILSTMGLLPSVSTMDLSTLLALMDEQFVLLYHGLATLSRLLFRERMFQTAMYTHGEIQSCKANIVFNMNF